MAPFHHFFFFWVCRRSTRVDASSTSNRHVFMLTLNSPSPTHGHWWLPVLWRSFWAPSLVSISQRLEVNDEAGQMQGGTWKPVNFFQSLEKKTGSSLDRDSGFDSILSARDDEGGRLTGQLSRMVGGGGNTVQLLLDFRSERRWEWNTGRLTKSCPALICSW